MKITGAFLLAAMLALASGVASAQHVVPAMGFDTGDRRGTDVYDDGSYDYARVIRVVPVAGGGDYRGRGECRSRDYQDDGYYGRDDYYGGDGYYGRGDRYGRDDYYGRNHGNGNGRAMASVVGSVIGALIGSQVGDGSGRIATSAIGSAVGAIAGQQVYENARRQRNVGRVTVCDPVRDGYGYDNRQYDVTYQYGGRTFTTRTNYDPGDRIRVRVIAE